MDKNNFSGTCLKVLIIFLLKFSSILASTPGKGIFQVLFAKSVTILKPFDNTITSSDADWIVADQLMVEALEGDPINLKQTVLFQESVTSPTATGAVSNVEEIFLGSKKYHRISLSKGSMDGTFKVNNKTQVVGTASSGQKTLHST